jgi:hypothetical protein
MNETRRESDFRNIGDILGGLATSIPRLLAGEAGNRAARSEERIRSRRDQSYLGAIGRELCRSLPGNVEDPETVLMKANERGAEQPAPSLFVFSPLPRRHAGRQKPEIEPLMLRAASCLFSSD